MTKRTRLTQAELERDIAAAIEFVEQQKRVLRSPDPNVRARAQQAKAEADRLDREIAQLLARRKPR